MGLNFAEFDTMVRHGLAIMVVVSNDHPWGCRPHGQDLIYGQDRRVVTDPSVIAPVTVSMVGSAAAGPSPPSEQSRRSRSRPLLRLLRRSGRLTVGARVP